MQFLSPIWLLGAAAVIIPVFIHLWNVRSGKVLKVGSIMLIEAASRKSSRSFKLLDIPLFILRCLLLILLALLLALPVWQKRIQLPKAKGWILIPRENLTETYQRFKIRVDSLTKAGYEFHYFNYGFGKSNLKQILLNSKDSIGELRNYATANYWNLLKELDTRTDATLPVYVFTPNQQRYFTGTKPEVALNMTWQTYIPADSVSTWIAEAWFTPSGEIRVVQGTGKPSGITYTYTNIKANDKANSVYSISTVDGKASIKLNGSKQDAVEINIQNQQIIIYADAYLLDAGYLKAALQAVSQFTQRSINIKTVKSISAIPANADWLFWLSDKSVGNTSAQNIFAYQSGTVSNTSSWISNANKFATSLADDEKTELFKTVKVKNPEGEYIWQDGFGNPVLTLQKGNSSIYHFYNRFNPGWNNLVWSSKFPAWMLKLMIEQKPLSAHYDKRVLSAQQYLPVITTNNTTTVAAKTTESKSLSRYFWLALVIIFAAERWLAHRKPNSLVA